MGDMSRCPAGHGLETVEVSRLANSLAFGYDAVAIVDRGDQYRLVVLNIGDFAHTFFSMLYDTLIDARYAFLWRFASPEVDICLNIKPRWTPFFVSWDELDYFTLHLINQQRMAR